MWRDGLFFKLINLIEDSIWRILYKYYSLSKICIKFYKKTPLSAPFLISEGVKQGGKLSSHLFNLYINDLIDDCKILNLGAKIGNFNVSIIAYCDDIILLSPLSNHLQHLLNKIHEYSILWKN
ncbi:unnamed protein product [Brachionus calyciflorus]|uniref:Reverse transcriptase domain-containing protein n=1 Tax=Brachionus calyciflorus TaxID=104777 RepID=A0A814DAN9_9BILA|nr:unnamed protein product [Brachionus calyciflorus]